MKPGEGIHLEALNQAYMYHAPLNPFVVAIALPPSLPFFDNIRQLAAIPSLPSYMLVSGRLRQSATAPPPFYSCHFVEPATPRDTS
jgi:hypothetical protein